MTARQIESACRGPRDIVRKDPKKKGKKKDSRKKWVREADKWASLDTRLHGECVICGSTKNLNCGHLFSRVAYSTRWDSTNLYCLCAGCNMAMENDPVIAEALLKHARSCFGEAAIMELHILYESARPVKTWEIREDAESWYEQYIQHCSWRGVEAKK
jgi:hypothetical protein